MVEPQRRPKITEPVTKDGTHPTKEEFAKLQRKVDFLWEMVMFLQTYPNYKVGDYMAERNDEVMAITGVEFQP